ncbi:chorismate--pyruvate lyase family protein [Nocardiopsis algeriensis]|uniref:chorismate--pyruvate lyase family protein n=1 Tax=Nocardiopsis algeriensis TaxID=1478215 RepID=UPI003B428777
MRAARPLSALPPTAARPEPGGGARLLPEPDHPVPTGPEGAPAVLTAPEAAVARGLSPEDLLGHLGSTTLLLEEALGCPLSVRLLERRTATASELPARVSRLLGLARSAPVIVRRSEMSAADGIPVSRNLVVSDARTPRYLAEILSDPRTPLGRALAATAGSGSRRIVSCGRTPWDGEGTGVGDAPCRDYLIRLPEAPPLYVAERFRPGLAGAP